MAFIPTTTISTEKDNSIVLDTGLYDDSLSITSTGTIDGNISDYGDGPFTLTNDGEIAGTLGVIEGTHLIKQRA
jgi:hypothetical protein